MGLQDIAPIIEADNCRKAMEEIWGHLAPVRSKTYKGRIVFAIGCFDSGELNPTPIIADFVGLDSSPWFYEAVHEFLQDLDEKWRQSGCVYEWLGTFRNYQFSGNARLLLDPNKK